MIFPEVVASSAEKLDFYCEILRCLMIWAICLPKNEVGQKSDIKHMYSMLKKDLDFEFPNVVML